MVNNMSNIFSYFKDSYDKIIYVPFSLIIAAFIIMFITTNYKDENAITALMSSYISVGISIFFIFVFCYSFLLTYNLSKTSNLLVTCVPFVIIIGVSITLAIYTSLYKQRIATNEVSDYYFQFTTLSNIFLFLQTILLFYSIHKYINGQFQVLIPIQIFSVLFLLGLINIIFVILLSIILNLYKTQG